MVFLSTIYSNDRLNICKKGDDKMTTYSNTVFEIIN